jgi:hypothetical protein
VVVCKAAKGRWRRSGGGRLTKFWFYDFLAMLLALDLFYKRRIVADFLLCRFKFVICKRILLSTKEFVLCENRITKERTLRKSYHGDEKEQDVNESCCRGIRSVRTYQSQSFTDT